MIPSLVWRRCPGLPGRSETGRQAIPPGPVSTANRKCLEATHNGALFCLPSRQLFQEAGDKAGTRVRSYFSPTWGPGPAGSPRSAATPESSEPQFPQMEKAGGSSSVGEPLRGWEHRPQSTRTRCQQSPVNVSRWHERGVNSPLATTCGSSTSDQLCVFTFLCNRVWKCKQCGRSQCFQKAQGVLCHSGWAAPWPPHPRL